MLIPALALLVTTAIAAAPSHAAAAGASGFRCAAIPVIGTVLGQSLPVASTGSVDQDCVAGSVAPTLDVPAPLAALVSVQAVNGATATSGDGVYAGAGLANLRIGSLPIPVPPIPVPAELTQIPVSIGPVKVATVDLTPAINAISSLPSRNLLEGGVVYSQALGVCSNGEPTLSGSSRILNASVLGLPIDASGTVDTAVNLVDTTSIALDTLDLQLAEVTLLGGVLNVDLGPGPRPAGADPRGHATAGGPGPGRAGQAHRLQPDARRRRARPARAACAGHPRRALDRRPRDRDRRRRRRRLRAGRDAHRAGCPHHRAGAPRSRSPAPPASSRSSTSCAAVTTSASTAPPTRAWAARSVSIVFQATGRTVARVRVQPDGSFTTTAPLPRRSIRNTNRARYVAKAAGERSLNLKLARRMVVTKITARRAP